MRKSIYFLFSLAVVLSMLLGACSQTQTAAPTTAPVEQPSEETAVEPTATTAPAEPAPVSESGEVVTVKWFVGIGAGGRPEQLDSQQAVVDKFNETHPNIHLELEIVPSGGSAREILSTRIAANDVPDIVGPVGVAGSNEFNGLYLDLQPYIDKYNYDLSQYDEASINFYNVPGEGMIGVPFGVYPAVLWYNLDLFDEAGLNYPPHAFGEKYVMPDGTEKDWDVDTMTELAKILTVDTNGKDATDPAFDPANITQFGFQAQWLDLRGTLAMFGAGKFVADDNVTAQIPDNWSAALNWYYDGIWKDHFIPNSTYIASDLLKASGGEFDSNHVGMAFTHLWYTCCVLDVKNWDVAVPPAYNGTYTSNLHVDTFRIMKGSQHPDEAFQVLQWLTTEASSELLLIYGSMPARKADQPAFFAELDKTFSQGVDWQVFVDALAYPDIPSHEGWLPNYNKSYARIGTLFTLIASTEGLNVNDELDKMKAELQAIYDEVR
ncbi:MAG: extracellular solute-binding protein [Chloroflexota bacterium]|nr:MAG: extracellular solute-binding protein [Chloroflexota bacterium]